MDLTVPYTFYPLVLPHWIVWTLFLFAMLGGATVGMVRYHVLRARPVVP
jgi:hypothetical protein